MSIAHPTPLFSDRFPGWTPELKAKVDRLEALLRMPGRVPLLIAYSGGVDSACLLAVARQILGRERVLGAIADSPSLPREALAQALELARALDVPVEILQTAEMEQPDYVRNPLNRCYFCKAELFTRMEALACGRGCAALAYGENADDPPHDRPGSRAAGEHAVLAPLRWAGLTKAEIREISRALHLPTAEAPSQPCLSSRIPFGTPVTREALGMVERGEAHLRRMGFRVLRVRHMVEAGEARARAKIQVAPEELPVLWQRQAEAVAGLLSVGYAAVEIDPQGYRPPV